MRIIHVSDSFTPVMGGIETQVSRLATQLANRGHDISVLTTTMRDPRRGLGLTVGEDNAGLAVDPPQKDVPYRVVRSEWPNPLELPVDPRAPKRFVEFIQEMNPDVVHVHVGELGPVATAVLLDLKDSDIPTVVTVHSVWSKFPTVPTYRELARAAKLRRAPILWLPNSELTAVPVRKVIDPSFVRVQNNTVDPDGWLRDPIAHEGLVAVTATRFAPRKRVPQLLAVLREVGKELGLNDKGRKGPGLDGTGESPELNAKENVEEKIEAGASPLRVIIAGEGPGLEAAQRFIERHGMTGWVELPGRLSQEELMDLYARSDLHISPSVKDAFSISGLEARAAGLAILARSQSGFGAAMQDGTEGRTVLTDKQLGEVLVEWTRSPEVVEDFKRHNRSVPMPYTWDNAIPQFEGHYRDAADLRRRG